MRLILFSPFSLLAFNLNISPDHAVLSIVLLSHDSIICVPCSCCNKSYYGQYLSLSEMCLYLSLPEMCLQHVKVVTHVVWYQKKQHLRKNYYQGLYLLYSQLLYMFAVLTSNTGHRNSTCPIALIIEYMDTE